MSVLKDLRPVKLMMFSRMDTLRLNSSSVEVSNCICSSISPLSPSSLLPQKCRVLGAKAGDFPFCYWKSQLSGTLSTDFARNLRAAVDQCLTTRSSLAGTYRPSLSRLGLFLDAESTGL